MSVVGYCRVDCLDMVELFQGCDETEASLKL